MNFIFENLNRTFASLREEDLPKHGILLLSHPRSGTHLSIDLLRKNFPNLRSRKPIFAPMSALYVSLDAVLSCSENTVPNRRVAVGLLQNAFPIIKTHWIEEDFSNLRQRNRDVANWIEKKCKRIYVIRHPLKTLASHLQFETSIGVDTTNVDEWLLDRGSYWFEHVEKWTENPDTLVIRFEDIIQDTFGTLDQLAHHIEQQRIVSNHPLPAQVKGLWRHRFSRLRLSPESTEIRSLRQVHGLSNLVTEETMNEVKRRIRYTARKFHYEV